MGNVGIFSSAGFSVYKTDTMSDLLYNTRLGIITQFTTTDGTIYIKVDRNSFDENEKEQFTWFGYCKKEEFLKYLVLKIERDEKKYYFDKLLEHFYNDFIKAEDGDILTTIRLNYEPSPSSNFCQMYSYKWDYKKDYDLTDETGNIIIPPENYPGFTKVGYTMSTSQTARLFFSNKYSTYVSNIIDPIEKKDKTYWLTLIGLSIHWINEEVFSIFNQSGILSQYIQNQNIEWEAIPIFSDPTIEVLQEYYNNLRDFYRTSYSNQKFIIGAKDEIKLFWLAHVLSPEALSIVPVDDKIELLRYIAKGTIKGETSHFFGEINEEEFVLKIITSITNVNTQIDQFLDYLDNVFYEGKKNEKTLFELLYTKINDAGIGNENLKKLMDLLYQKWLLSSYYPYNLDGSVKDDLINLTKYNDKPINIDYKASDFLWIFNSTNYDFDIKGRKINIVKDGYKINPVTGNAIPIDISVGTYSIYQAVTIKNTDENTENTKFITTTVGGEQKAILPIFYLKYIDDKKSTENLETALELTFDLALTFSGIGNLAKLRHLKHLTPFGRVALLLDAPGANLIRYELAQGAAGLIEVSSTVADILLTYGDDNYINTYCTVGSSTYDQQKCEFYTRLNLLVNVLQIFSGALDYVTSRQLRNASKKLLDSPIPPNFDSEVLLVLQKFAGNTAEITNVFRAKLINSFGNNSQIINKLDNLPTSPINKQEMFILDFERASDDVLNNMNANNAELIDEWYGINHLQSERKKISFLKNNKILRSHPRLHIHIHDGHAGLMNGRPYVTGVHNMDAINLIGDGGIHRFRWQNISDVRTNSKGYKYGKIERNMSDFNWTGGNPPSPWKVKSDKTTFWPSAYGTQRINEEMALAFTNKKFKRIEYKRNGKHINVFYGKASDGQTIQINVSLSNPNDIVSIYPIKI